VRPAWIPPLFRRLAYHALLGGSAAALLGAIDAGVTGGGSVPLALGMVVGSGLTATVGVGVGVVQGLVITLGSLVLAHTPVPRHWARMTDAHRDGERQPIVRLHANVLTALAACGAFLGAEQVLAGSTDSIKDEALRADVTAWALLAAFGTLFVTTRATAPFVERLLARFDRRWGLPFPRWATLRYLLYVLLPAGALLVPPFFTYGAKLGLMSRLLGVLLFWVVEGMLHRLAVAAHRGLARRAWGPALAASATGAGIVTCAVVAAVMLNRSRSVVAFIDRTNVSAALVNSLQGATDVDRDGISSWYGGRDCAPFDAQRSPTAVEIPANGIDEDCNGDDPPEVKALTKPATYYGKPVIDEKRRFNLLWVIVDSLRADHLDLYGYDQTTSPGLTRLGKESWVFLNAFSQSSTTSISIPSMLTGRLPGKMKWVSGTFPAPAPSERALAQVLTASGYATTFIANAYVKNRLPELSRGYSETRTSPAGVNWKSGDAALKSTLLAIDAAEKKSKPFFITVHIDDVHHPYTSQRGRALPTFPKTPGPEPKNRSDYDRTIANFDNWLTAITTNLRHSDRWKDTIVIVTADHGEEFREHGGEIHSATCYDEVVRVPLVLKVPDLAAKRVLERVALVDIVPTLVELLGLDQREFDLDGQSLLMPIYSPETVDAERPMYCAIYQLLSGRKNFFTRSVRTANRTLIQEALSDRFELYDTELDPGERRDVSADAGYADDLTTLKEQLQAELTGNLFAVRRFK
jgi:arylsulfatase A-like enzyme